MYIRLRGEDLLRTRLAAAPVPTDEIVFSVRLLRASGNRAHWPAARRMAGWREQTARRLVPAMRPLLDVIPGRGSEIPDFVTPPGVLDLETAIDRVLSTPRGKLRANLEPLMAAGLVPTRAGPLCDGELTALHELGEAMRRYHAAFIAPQWSGITTLVDADQGYRKHQLAVGGMERLLNTLAPDMSWDSVTLTYTCGEPVTVDIALEGHGMVLQPSVFAPESCLQVPGEGPAVLVYPALLEHRAAPPGDVLAALLGQTRAAVLAAVPPSATTTQLACRVGVSIASASQHAAVLRRAGLISTVRTGPAVQHTLTPLGSELLGTPRTPD